MDKKSDQDFGKIDVRMGSFNRVDHIGHKITFHAPPPDPNSIWQDNVVVGTIGAPPQETEQGLFFQKLFIDEAFNPAAPFNVQGVTLRIISSDASSSVSIGGRPRQITFWNVHCNTLAG